MKTQDIIRALTETSGIAGDESRVAELVGSFFAPLCDRVTVDKLQNVIGFKKGDTSKGSIMLAAHIDQIGLMVNAIEEGGFLRCVAVGGIDPRVLVGTEVAVLAKKTLSGIVGSKPPHLQSGDEASKAEALPDLFVDTGLTEKKVRSLVTIGDYITFKGKMRELKNDVCAAPAMDNRASVLVVVETLKVLKKMRHAWDVYAVGTVQEEVGTRGAMVTAYGLQPTVGVAIDVTFADFPGCDSRSTNAMGKGPAIAAGPNFHPMLTKKIKELADTWDIPWQDEFVARPGGTDAVSMQISGRGVPMLGISIPLRYMHTTVETISLKDIRRCARLLAVFISELDVIYEEAMV